MKYNMLGDWTSLAFLVVLMVYIFKENFDRNTKEILFRVGSILVAAVVVSNMLASYASIYIEYVPLWATHAVTFANYFFSSQMATMLLLYTIIVIKPNFKFTSKMIFFYSLPSLMYSVLLLFNLSMGFIYVIVPDVGYYRTELYYLNYFPFVIAVFHALRLLVSSRKTTGKYISRAILSLFIFLFFLIMLQFMFPAISLVGTVSTMTLMTLHFYFQNKSSFQDGLTNLKNRKAIVKDIEYGVNTGIRFSMLIISIRDFKQINDRFGHDYGDKLLKQFANFLRTIAPEDKTYRFLGDIYAIIFDDTDKDEQMEDCIRKIIERSNRPWESTNFSNYIKVAISSIDYPEIAASTSEIISGIEYSLSEAKKGTGTVYLKCTNEMIKAFVRKGEIIEILKDALINDKFEIHYQPIWNVHEKRFIQMEALLRLNDTPLGDIYPDEFIPLAEESGIIVDITYLTLDRVCKFLNVISKMSTRHFQEVAINFSAIQFTQYDLSEKIIEIIKMNGTDPSKIKIEITESILLENPVTVRKFLNDINKFGIQFSLDDFGTGYSNTASLLSLPLETIKIDKSIVWLVFEDKSTKGFIEHLMGSFISMGFKIVAEGIENKDMRDYMELHGCHMMQGYYYSKPLREDKLIAFLNDIR